MKSVYIHIPFCSNICSYCDFPKLFYNGDLSNKYLEALNNEIAKTYKGEIVRTLYIGGGTPSALNLKQLELLFKIVKTLNLSQSFEFTIECNINDITEEKLLLFKNNGVNRLSIGVQTFNNHLLKILNRNNDNPIAKINLAKSYFDNISIDLIYGINTETIEDLKKDMDMILELDVKHISTYSLILEEHTKLYTDQYKEIDEDLNFEMYNYINERLTRNGFAHYETSNYAKTGYESKHNLVYWNNEEYYGFGLGAGSYINGFRNTNTRNINDYINGKYLLESNKLSKKEMMENEMILGLRKIKGVSTKDFINKYSIAIDEVFNIKDLIAKEYLIHNNDYLYINPKYIFLSNEILINFID